MSRPRNIILIRHGQSEANVDKTIYKTKPDYAMELTELGKQQALEAGLKIKEYLSMELKRWDKPTHKYQYDWRKLA
jgi:broad specificity phosphatase PhoE